MVPDLGGLRDRQADGRRMWPGPAHPDPERPGWAWLSLTCFEAEGLARSGDIAAGERAFTDLLPYGDRLATGQGLLPAGPVAYYLGRLAGLCGRDDEAEGFYKDALERCSRSGLTAWESRVRAAAASI
jgi:hypothetical protein